MFGLTLVKRTAVGALKRRISELEEEGRRKDRDHFKRIALPGFEFRQQEKKPDPVPNPGRRATDVKKEEAPVRRSSPAASRSSDSRHQHDDTPILVAVSSPSYCSPSSCDSSSSSSCDSGSSGGGCD